MCIRDRGYPLVFLSVLCTCLFGLYLGAFFGTIYRTLGAAWVVVTSIGYAAVSYTHLDVYKRQRAGRSCASGRC